MYKNILVPVLLDKDHDTAGAYQVARALAADGARHHVIHVIETIPAYAGTQIGGEILQETREQTMHDLKESARDLPNAEVHMVTGHAAKAILDYAAGQDCDCIIVASHRPGMEDFFLGSTASRVVRHARCAVHVIR